MPRIETLAMAGAALSAYALYVEYRHEYEVEGESPFVALCDIDVIGASCSYIAGFFFIALLASNTFSLPQSRLVSYFGFISKGSALDVPNAALGLIYYVFLLSGSFGPVPGFVAATAAMCTSIYLAYTLTVLKELCVLCWSTHVINSLLLYKMLMRFLEERVKSKRA